MRIPTIALVYSLYSQIPMEILLLMQATAGLHVPQHYASKQVTGIYVPINIG